jgi:hypothetical protein
MRRNVDEQVDVFRALGGAGKWLHRRALDNEEADALTIAEARRRPCRDKLGERRDNRSD